MLFNELASRALGALTVWAPSRTTNLESRSTAPLDSYISSEGTTALQGILNNIGPNGSQVSGALAGVVVASPSTDFPNYFYTWTRDSALTFKYLISAYIAGNTSLRDLIQSYILAQGKLQQLDNPSGGFTTGGLGEPKFHPNLTAFTGDWGRPQRDGSALRASTLIAYANHLRSLNQTNVVKAVIWPVVQNDLSYVSQYWNQTGFDLWEEVNGSSIFTTAMQQRALVEGSDLAKALGESCPHCDSQAPEIACFMESYWWGNRSISNQNVQSQGYTRSGYDCASILTSIHLFDAKAKCDVDGYQPCQGKALANHKAVVDSMRKSYRIQDDLQPIFEGKAAPVGRYPEDVYYDGNPWYLCTSAAAEQLYKAVYQWHATGSIVVDQTSQSFFKDIVPNITTGTIEKSSQAFTQVTDAVKQYADQFAFLVELHAMNNGSLSEQFSKSNGTAVSARDLTWSYAAFNTMAMARAGGKELDMETWNSSSIKAPDQCKPSSTSGSYIKATATSFPPGSSGVAASGTQTSSGGGPSQSSKSAAAGRVRPFKLFL